MQIICGHICTKVLKEALFSKSRTVASCPIIREIHQFSAAAGDNYTFDNTMYKTQQLQQKTTTTSLDEQNMGQQPTATVNSDATLYAIQEQQSILQEAVNPLHLFDENDKNGDTINSYNTFRLTQRGDFGTTSYNQSRNVVGITAGSQVVEKAMEPLRYSYTHLALFLFVFEHVQYPELWDDIDIVKTTSGSYSFQAKEDASHSDVELKAQGVKPSIHSERLTTVGITAVNGPMQVDNSSHSARVLSKDEEDLVSAIARSSAACVVAALSVAIATANILQYEIAEMQNDNEKDRGILNVVTARALQSQLLSMHEILSRRSLSFDENDEDDDYEEMIVANDKNVIDSPSEGDDIVGNIRSMHRMKPRQPSMLYKVKKPNILIDEELEAASSPSSVLSNANQESIVSNHVQPAAVMNASTALVSLSIGGQSSMGSMHQNPSIMENANIQSTVRQPQVVDYSAQNDCNNDTNFTISAHFNKKQLSNTDFKFKKQALMSALNALQYWVDQDPNVRIDLLEICAKFHMNVSTDCFALYFNVFNTAHSYVSNYEFSELTMDTGDKYKRAQEQRKKIGMYLSHILFFHSHVLLKWIYVQF